MSKIKWESCPDRGHLFGDRWFGKVGSCRFFIIERHEKEEYYNHDHYSLSFVISRSPSSFIIKIKTLDEAKVMAEENLDEWLRKTGLVFKEDK